MGAGRQELPRLILSIGPGRRSRPGLPFLVGGACHGAGRWPADLSGRHQQTYQLSPLAVTQGSQAVYCHDSSLSLTPVKCDFGNAQVGTKGAPDGHQADTLQATRVQRLADADADPMIRVDGDMRKINVPALDHKTVHGLVYDIMNDKQRKDYEEFFETDFSFEIPNLARFRVNAFNQNRGSAAVFRTIPSEILTLDDLGAPAIFKDISMYPRGIVLVTGPTGSGKSTTLAALLLLLPIPMVTQVQLSPCCFVCLQDRSTDRCSWFS